MSADRYLVCPKCLDQHHGEISKAINAAQEAYGKVSVKEYGELIQKTTELASKRLPEDLGESSEIGIYNGEFRVDFSAYCSKCGWQFSFKHKAQAYVKET